MSKEINNREYRQQVIRELIGDLHAGRDVEEVKKKFAEVFDGVSAEEISQAEQALIDGGLPVEEVQRLCDVHAAVFKGSIEQIHGGGESDDTEKPGHPAHTLKEENRAVMDLIEKNIKPDLEAVLHQNTPDNIKKLWDSLNSLSQIDLHYLKKENLLFPYLEKYGITAPPKVMWGVDDEIRGLVKNALAAVAEYRGNGQELKRMVDAAADKAAEMIYKEENIMLPMLTESLAADEWTAIAREERELGYCLITSPPVWNPSQAGMTERRIEPGTVQMPTGQLTAEEITRMLDAMPVDITFVDKDDTVKYFSNGTERIFPRTKTIIGRKVANCHPPASVHIVEGIVADFKTGKKDHEDFWLKLGDRFVYIRYFAVRSKEGEYLGTLEVTQDIGPLQAITGEKRLVED